MTDTATVLESIAKDVADTLPSVAAPTLGDLIRLGSRHTTQVGNWGSGDKACALSAAALAARSLGVID